MSKDIAQARIDNPQTAAATDALYGDRAGVEAGLLCGDIANINLSLVKERTKQHNFTGTALTPAANVSWDLDSNQETSLELDQVTVIDNPTNMVDGGKYTLHITQDATGSWTVTWGAAFKWPGGTPPVITPTLTTGHDVIKFTSDGTSMFGSFAGRQDYS